MVRPSEPIAHACVDASGNWELHGLEQHLLRVAELAGASASVFKGEEWASLAGRWHDLGKYRPAFQRYIRNATGLDATDAHIEGKSNRTTHSTAGAVLAEERLGIQGRVLSYLIAGHHAGLHDWDGGLDCRLSGEDARRELDESLAAGVPDSVLSDGGFSADLREVPGGSDGFAFWVRMLFSCLVDADFLDTEAFLNPEQSARRGNWPTLDQLRIRFEQSMTEMVSKTERTPVNRLRGAIRAECTAAAEWPPGRFSLTVPTGGGKTLSSMAFALAHARRHQKRRIIYVIPYTSIIEQTADVFRDIFGDAVVEHHSNAEVEPGTETAKSRLACENWDAPIIVTTSVQFFESLFAARTSRCRKLHNVVNSIVVLDEVQLLPPELLQPILDALTLLSEHYGVSLVLSTATQPALASRTYFDTNRNVSGLDNVREIIGAPNQLYADLKRVQVHLPADFAAPVPWDKLAAELAGHTNVLAIVNTRRHARELHGLMPSGTLHLSALMCGAHRSRVIAEIKTRLKAGEPTQVVSTQLVEAGVDLDFPVVYRASAGLDSIAQAAGRCNREGRLEQGDVFVFVPPSAPPAGLLRKAEAVCRGLLYDHVGDPLDLGLFTRYFEHLYYACDLDAKGVRDALRVAPKTLGVSFRTAAQCFRMIDDEDSAPVIVRYRPADDPECIDKLIGLLRKQGTDRWLMRKLQRYTVNIPREQALRLLEQHDVEELVPGLFLQNSDWLYHPTLGLLTDRPAPTAQQCII
jgi:CRISPR-associated endonuclease/helicase Cas3